MASSNPGDSVPRSQRVRELFDRAWDLPSKEREAFVRREAGDNEALADEVLAHLRGAALGNTEELKRAGRAALEHLQQAPSAPQSVDLARATPPDELLHRLANVSPFDDQRYQVEGEVGRGGMGIVVCAHDRHLNRRLAMKRIREPNSSSEPHRSEQMLAQFLEEAQVTSQLDHPGVVPVHELGLDRHGKAWFTMRLVKGKTAHDVFALARTEQDGWTTTRALEVVLKVCDTIAYAHDKGVLHRDLKPNNVMVGRFGEVYVMDWGLARKSGAEEPGRSVKGTPSYMSPEQANGEPLDERSDIYAIGALTYELLTGQAPYPIDDADETPDDILARVRRGAPPRLGEVGRAVPVELAAIVDKAMARDRTLRYQRVVDLAADLRAFVDQRAVQAYRTGALVELRLWVRRNKALAASLAAAVLVLVAGVVGTTINANRASEAAAAEKETSVKLASKVAEFEVLAASETHRVLLAEERVLWPPWPNKVEPMDRWLEETNQLLHFRPTLETVMRSLRQRATPLSTEEIARQRGAHPRFREWLQLESRVRSLQRARAVRQGLERGEPATLTPEQAAHSTKELLQHARENTVHRPGQARRVWGNEAFGLAAAQEVLERTRAGAKDVTLCDAHEVVAWACFANGLDTKAVEHAEAAIAAVLEEGQHKELHRLDLGHLRQAIAESADTLARAERDLEALRELMAIATLRFPPSDRGASFLHSTLAQLVAQLPNLETRSAAVASRRSFATQLQDLQRDTDHRETWDRARRAVAVSPNYAGRLIPLLDDDIVGLVPIGENPQTKLWEFYDLASAWDGKRAVREIPVPSHEVDGSIRLTAATGVVFVLLPGGATRIGSQGTDPNAPRYVDPKKAKAEPLCAANLEPFFIARHEVTQAQYLRLMGSNPSEFRAGTDLGILAKAGGAHPVESVSWLMARDCAARAGMVLPTEAQWEYACRAGTDTTWFCGNDVGDVPGYGNLKETDDSRYTWACGSGTPNAFGLFDTIGNVAEWCLDEYSVKTDLAPGDGLHLVPDGSDQRVLRGGSFANAPELARSAHRMSSVPDSREFYTGFRAARRLHQQ